MRPETRVTRGGREKERDGPERRCIVTRESGSTARLIRFVVGPEDEIVPDLAERLPGRGIWVSAEAGALGQAVKRGLFPRAARRSVKVAPDLAERVEALLVRHVVDLIALARKAGEAVTGFEKVKAALVSGKAALLVQAADGSVRGRGELRPPEGENSLVSCLSGHELGLAFGRDSVIHAAVLAGGLSDRIRDEALRLSGVRVGRNGEPGEPGAVTGLAGDRPRGKG